MKLIAAFLLSVVLAVGLFDQADAQLARKYIKKIFLFSSYNLLILFQFTACISNCNCAGICVLIGGVPDPTQCATCNLFTHQCQCPPFYQLDVLGVICVRIP